MEPLVIVGALVGVVVIAYLIMAAHARGIQKAHATALSRETGMAAQAIYQEMLRGQATAGDWAARHGLDPMTFQRIPTEAEIRSEAERIWSRMRLDEQSTPPEPAVLMHISALQGEFAQLLTSNPPLLVEVQRQNAILVELQKLGVRIDAEWVNLVVRQSGRDPGRFNGPLTQEEYDQWQREQVAAARPAGAPGS